MSISAPDPQPDSIASEERSRALESASYARCDQCGALLYGRQKRFCSRHCCSAWWDDKHPRINRGPEGPREGSIQAAILGILHDGDWHTKADLAFRARAHEHSVGTRLSELRRKGFRIESDGTLGDTTRAHRFRLVLGS